LSLFRSPGSEELGAARDFHITIPIAPKTRINNNSWTLENLLVVFIRDDAPLLDIRIL